MRTGTKRGREFNGLSEAGRDVMTNEKAPERIIVCTGGHKPAIADWAKDKVKDCDVEYVRVDLATLATAAPVVDEAPLDNEAVDKELRRWQDAIRDKLIDLGAPDWKIDGAGCDSGDPLDFTLAEVGQGCGWFIDQIEELKTTPKVMGQLRAALQSDPDYAWGWHCNIAMAAFDEGLDREAANRAAARFLKNCFGIDTEQRSKTDEWPDVIKEF